MNAATRALEFSDFETCVSRAYYAACHAVIATFEVRLRLYRRRRPISVASRTSLIAATFFANSMYSASWQTMKRHHSHETKQKRLCDAVVRFSHGRTRFEMRKTKEAIRKVVQSLSSELEGRFPGLGFETIEEPGDGYDAWLRVYLPDTFEGQTEFVKDIAFKLADELDQETTVAVLPMVRRKEAVHG